MPNLRHYWNEGVTVFVATGVFGRILDQAQLLVNSVRFGLGWAL